MLLAATTAGDRVRANPGGQAFCPSCMADLIPKCGEIKVWHWAHRTDDCDPWSEPESQWHIDWKTRFGLQNCEVVMGPHRADVVARDGLVIELQHSHISPEEIAERQRFYRRMIWVVDAGEFREHVDLRLASIRTDPYRQQPTTYRSFRWRWPRPTHARFTSPLFWDFGDGTMLNVRKIHPETPCGGWGYLWTKPQFVRRFAVHVDELGDALEDGATA